MLVTDFLDFVKSVWKILMDPIVKDVNLGIMEMQLASKTVKVILIHK